MAEKNPAPKPSSSNTTRHLLFSVMYLAIIALGGTVSVLWKKVQLLDIQTQNENSGSQVLIHAEGQRISEHQKAMVKLDKRIDAINRQLSRSSGPSPWANATHFIMLASYQLNFLHNADGGIQWLEQAKQSLAGLSDDRSAKVRQRIDQEIGHLQSTNSWRMDATLSKLQQVYILLPELIMVTTDAPMQAEAEPAITEDTNTKPSHHALVYAKKTGQRLLAGLRKLVVIERDHEPDAQTAPTTTQQRLKLMRYLKATVQQAQWAVMYQHPAFYKSNIHHLQRMLRVHANTENPKVQQLQSLLATLDSTDISPSATEFSDILTLLADGQRAALESHPSAPAPQATQPETTETPQTTAPQPDLPTTSGVF